MGRLTLDGPGPKALLASVSVAVVALAFTAAPPVGHGSSGKFGSAGASVVSAAVPFNDRAWTAATREIRTFVYRGKTRIATVYRDAAGMWSTSGCLQVWRGSNGWIYSKEGSDTPVMYANSRRRAGVWDVYDSNTFRRRGSVQQRGAGRWDIFRATKKVGYARGPDGVAGGIVLLDALAYPGCF